jgi:DNA repair protein RadB
VALCKKLMKLVKWPGLLTVYGAPGSGKTNITLAFLKHFCKSKCVYASTNTALIPQRLYEIGFKDHMLDIITLHDYIDLVRLVLLRDIHVNDIIAIDPINTFAREAGPGYDAVAFSLAALRYLSDRLGLPIIVTAEVHLAKDSSDIRPVAEKPIMLWSHNVARLEKIKSGIYRFTLEKPLKATSYFEIVSRGIRWLQC